MPRCFFCFFFVVVVVVAFSSGVDFVWIVSYVFPTFLYRSTRTILPWSFSPFDVQHE